jgi:SsrA-binding protein
VPEGKRAETGSKTVAQNRRARHDYAIEETIEAGIALFGTEVKSLRRGQASITEAYASDQGGELFLLNAHIAPYDSGKTFGHEPRRPRKLLLHRREIDRMIGAIRREGMTLVPLSIFFNNRGRAKVTLGLAKGKRKADRREDVKERDWQRQKARLLRTRR